MIKESNGNTRIKNIIYEIKNSLVELNSRLEMTKGRVSKCEDRSRIIQSKNKEKKNFFK